MEKKLDCILLIDDNELTNFLDQTIIESQRCINPIKSVQSEAEAYSFMINSTETVACPDLVHSDVNMPAMNRWRSIGKYKALKKGFKSKAMTESLVASLLNGDRSLSNKMSGITEFENEPFAEEKLDLIIKKNLVMVTAN